MLVGITRLRVRVHRPRLNEQTNELVERCDVGDRDFARAHQAARHPIKHPFRQKLGPPLLTRYEASNDTAVSLAGPGLDLLPVERMPRIADDPKFGFVCSVSCFCSATT
jgi:hypothetical protein